MFSISLHFFFSETEHFIQYIVTTPDTASILGLVIVSWIFVYLLSDWLNYFYEVHFLYTVQPVMFLLRLFPCFIF